MRRRAIFAACLWLLSTAPVESQSAGCPGQSAAYVQFGTRQAITVSNTAVGFTAANYASDNPPPGSGQVQMAMVTLETNPIRISTDGVVPTAAVGELWTNSTNVKFMVCGTLNVQRFLAIRTGSDAAITVSYWRSQ